MRLALGDMTWEDVREVVGPRTIAIVPTGATEQHGPHLPLLVDVILAQEFARKAAEAVSEQVRTIVTPAIWLAPSHGHMRFPGTLTSSAELFLRTAKSVCESLHYHGFRRFLILNGHGGNDAPIQIAAREIAAMEGTMVAAFSYWSVAREAMSSISEPNIGVGHAGEFETACMMAVRPDLVREVKIRPNVTTWRSELARTLLMHGGAFVRGGGLGDLKSEAGIYGNPAQATREQGERLVQLVVNSVAQLVREMAAV